MNRSARWLVALVASCALAVSGCTSSGGPAQPSSSGTTPQSSTTAAPMPVSVSEGPPPPKSGVYLGAWVLPVEGLTQSTRVSAVQAFQQSIGTKLDIVHLYRKWGQEIGTESDRVFARSGKILLLSWATLDTKRIAAGGYDQGLIKGAKEIASLPTEVMLEPRWEMDRPNLRSLVHSPADYIAAWKHIREIFAQQHVTNVAWTWCPTAAGFADGDAADFYPGDDEVDWVCADVYPTHPFRAGSYESFGSLTQPFMDWTAHHPKPVLIGEFGVGITYGSRRAGWIAQAGQYIRAHPTIKAVAYFEQSRSQEPPIHRYNLRGDPAALRAFADLVKSGYFGKGGG